MYQFVLGVFIYNNGSKAYLKTVYNNGSKAYPKTVAVITANNLRPIFNRSYMSTKRVYIKVVPCSQTAFE